MYNSTEIFKKCIRLILYQIMTNELLLQTTMYIIIPVMFFIGQMQGESLYPQAAKDLA